MQVNRDPPGVLPDGGVKMEDDLHAAWLLPLTIFFNKRLVQFLS